MLEGVRIHAAVGVGGRALRVCELLDLGAGCSAVLVEVEVLRLRA